MLHIETLITTMPAKLITPSPGAEAPEILQVALVRVDDGTAVAYGEALLADLHHLDPAVELFADVIGAGDVLDFDLLWQRMALALKEGDPPSVADYSAVLGAVDIALWDLAGRRLGVPCHRLLGGRRTRRLDCCLRGLRTDDPALTEKVQKAAARFSTVQVTVTGSVDEAVATLHRVRRELGFGVRLIADLGELRLDSPEAVLELAAELEADEIYWLEDPLETGRWSDCSRVRSAAGIPIACGARLSGVRPFAAVLQAQAADILTVDVVRCGGISAARRIADLAWLHGVVVGFTGTGGPLSLAAAAHLGTAFFHAGLVGLAPSTLLQEAMVAPQVEIADGFIAVPEGPGLGVVVREDVL